jgi:hypothetical protein
MSTEESKALARRFIEEGFSTGNLALADEIIAPSFVNYDPCHCSPYKAVAP